MTQMIEKFQILIVPALLLTGCERTPPVAPEPSPQDVFFERLSLLCEKAYPGKLVSADPVDAAMAAQPMIMHVTNCKQDQLQIPFHVGEENGEWNRSRTWIVTRTENGIRLKHRHRHKDGSLDVVTNYGGDTAATGTAERQEFPVDEESIVLFNANELTQSIVNIWAMEISPPGVQDTKFAYELQRPEGPDKRFFRVEFDLSASIDPPPPVWGE